MITQSQPAAAYTQTTTHLHYDTHLHSYIQTTSSCSHTQRSLAHKQYINYTHARKAIAHMSLHAYPKAQMHLEV